jgi:glycosyltransferase involved in cell wall biosynthesis
LSRTEIASPDDVQQEADDVGAIEVSFVMPCLNEAETLERCIRKARLAVERHRLSAEIIVADNGSSDGSQEIARRLGARVVHVPVRGYGSALHGGIEAARGTYVIMGDSDDSYDFSAIGPFLEKLRDGYDLVMGNRFLGGIDPGAMPWKHRWIGNPLLTAVGRLFFHAPAGDFHCGLRAFRRDAYARIDLRASGMEFASEMVIKAALAGLRIAEVPIVLHKDGRSRSPHLRSWRDGWRHLRFMLLFSPRWLFLFPGLVLFLVGAAVATVLVVTPVQIGSMVFDIHTLLVCGVLALVGHQVIIFGIFTKMHAIREGFHPPQTHLTKWFPFMSLEFGVLLGLLMLIGGAVTLGMAAWGWREVSFGELNPRVTMRQVIPSVILMVLGIQTIFASFFIGILSLRASGQRRP